MKNQSSKIWVRNTCRFFPLSGSRRIRETSWALLTSSIARTGESKPSGRQGGGSKSCVRDIHTITDVDATTARTTHHKPHFIEVSPRLSCLSGRRRPAPACVSQSDFRYSSKSLRSSSRNSGPRTPLKGWSRFTQSISSASAVAFLVFSQASEGVSLSKSESLRASTVIQRLRFDGVLSGSGYEIPLVRSSSSSVRLRNSCPALLLPGSDVSSRNPPENCSVTNPPCFLS